MTGGGKMEEYLGVNGRQLFVRERCNLEQCECGSFVRCPTFRLRAAHVIPAAVA